MDEATIGGIIQAQRQYFRTGATLPVEHRLEALRRLQKSIRKYDSEISAALKTDLGKSSYEGYMCETGIVLNELSYTLRHLRRWAKERRYHTAMGNFPAVSSIVQEPYGTVLIMAPWNYPVMLTLDPLIGAIAAGNTAVIKPSRYSPACMAVVQKIIADAFIPEYVAVIPGGREENTILLEQKFDYIFFTGSVAVGRLVMEKAARYLTPVTLELGGKSPVIVDATANIPLAARRIAFGKIVNCGQTCIAPDYLMIEASVKEEFLSCYRKELRSMLGEHPLCSGDYGKIINQKHYDRLCGLLATETILMGGERNEETLQIAPTVLDDVSPDAPIMQEEIFGPILPVMTFTDIREVKSFIESRPKPLACYVFTNDAATERLFKETVSFGGGCINDVINHVFSEVIPFGGVGESGMGSYHGHESFRTFSHAKNILKKSRIIDIPLRYHPYKKYYDAIVRLILK